MVHLVDCGFSPVTKTMIKVAIRTGEQLSANKWSNALRLKGHAEFDSSSTSDADEKSQEYIIRELQRHFPEASFIAEEKATGLKAWRPNDPLSFFVDPRDGTTEAMRDGSLWSVSLGAMDRMNHLSGVIVMPELRGGLTVAGELGTGVFFWEHGKRQPIRARKMSAARPGKPLLSLGLDVQRHKIFAKFAQALPDDLKPRRLDPSCACGLAHTAIGRTDVFVQSPQMPWDWNAGRLLNMEAGRAAKWYLIVGGQIREVPAPTFESYAITDRQTLGFVIGHPMLVEEVFGILVDTVGK